MNASTSRQNHRWWHAADRVGATASMLCAVHCAALPFVVAVLPLLGLGFLAGHTFERVFVSVAAVLATVVLLAGWRRHHHVGPMLLAVPGLALLLGGIAVDLDASVLVHSILVTSGGLLLAGAHMMNLRLSRRRRVCASVSAA